MKSEIKKAAVNKVKDAVGELFNFPQLDSDIVVWFILEGKEFEASQFSIGVGQSVDFKGQPQNEVRGGLIHLTLTEAMPSNIYKWAMTSLGKDGVIEFRSKTSNSPFKVKFTNGFCVNFNRVVGAGSGLSTTLVIASEEVSINEIVLDNHWT